MTENKTRKKGVWHVIYFMLFGFFLSSHNSLFEYLADGDEKREEEVTFTATKILHIIALCIVPTVFIADIVVLLIEGNGYSSDNIYGRVVFINYFVTPLGIIVGAFFPKIVNWKTWSKTSKIGICLNHVFRLSCFVVIALTGLGGTANFNTFFCIIPIFIISAIALIITFPTKKKWREWSDWTSQIE